MYSKNRNISYFLGWVLVLLPQAIGAAAHEQVNHIGQIPANPIVRKELMLGLLTRIITHYEESTNELQQIVNEDGPDQDDLNETILNQELNRLRLLRLQFQTLRDHVQLTPAQIESFILRYEEMLQLFE